MWLFSRKLVLKKVNDIGITRKLPHINTIAERKKEISYSIYNELPLRQHGWHKNLLIPKVNKVNKKRDNTFPAL